MKPPFKRPPAPVLFGGFEKIHAVKPFKFCPVPMSASPDTWVPWYIGDFLAATLHMDADEDGAYRRLLDALWMSGGVLQEVNDTFAIITKLGQERWLKSRPVVAAKFQISGKEWRHHRVTQEIEKARNFRSRASAGGRGKAAKRLLNGNSNGAKSVLKVS